MSGEREGLSGEIAALADVLFENSDEPMWSAVVIAKAQWDALADLLAGWERRARGEALRELADGTRRIPADPDKAAAWLRDRADRIEPLGESRLAEVWDEGWITGQLWAFSDLDAHGKHANPYRIEAP